MNDPPCSLNSKKLFTFSLFLPNFSGEIFAGETYREYYGLEKYLEQQNYSEDQNLKSMVIHSKPCTVKMINFTIDFPNNFFDNFC